MNNESKYYGVSLGDGNNGVSHIFPSYVVRTDDPWQLAYLAGLSEFNVGEGQEWAKTNMELSGEEDYSISVVFLESFETQEERKELIDEAFRCDYAWLILEVFPFDPPYNNRPMCVYDSLEDCFVEEFIKANTERV